MPLHHVEAVMGTAISIEIVDHDDQALVDRLVQWFHHVDAEFSPYRDDSAITMIGTGRLAPTDPAVSHEVRAVLQRCGELCEESDGAFDVWSLPSPNGTRFDPCGYVKGWSVERAADMLRADGAQHFCINAGGDVAVGGRQADGSAWRIGVRHPLLPDALAFVVAVHGRAGVATSGTYERGAHIIDPRTGTAAAGGVLSAIVVGPDLAEADAFATTLVVMGIDGLEWVERHPGYSGCVITRDAQVSSTPTFDRHLTS